MKSVLFVRLSAMGDLVQGLGAIAALGRARPDWRITVLTQRPFLPLLAGAAGVSEALGFDRRGGVRAVRDVRRELRRRRFDVAVDLQGNWKSALLTRLSGSREAIGAAAAWRREPSSRRLLQRTVEIGGVAHPARVAWRLAQALAPELPFEHPRLAATAAECELEAERLRTIGIDPAKPFRVFVVTDPADPRALRAEVVAREADAAMPALLLLGPDEADYVPRGGAPILRHARGEIRQLIALGACVATAGGEVVGPDQGATHVLAAAGARCEVRFGPQDPRRTAPPAGRLLVAPSGPACRPCSRRTCDHAEGPVCMRFGAEDGVSVSAELPPVGAVFES